MIFCFNWILLIIVRNKIQINHNDVILYNEIVTDYFIVSKFYFEKTLKSTLFNKISFNNHKKMKIMEF